MTTTIYPESAILLIDDEEHFLRSAQFTLSSEGLSNVITCADSRRALETLAQQPCSVVILDLNMPHLSGWDLLPQITGRFPDLPIVVITAVNEVETAVRCIKAGAFDYLVKPVDDGRLITVVTRALQFHEVRLENERLKYYLLTAQLQHPDKFAAILTNDPAMRGIFQYIEAIAQTPLPVLITGETGTGKELIARAVHEVSGRRGEFIAVNVAGLDDQLFSDALFGHQKGAFTGADRDRKGLIEKAAGGSLFLDEIGDLRPESQVKLLRLLQDGQYYPIGSDAAKLSDARIIVATLRDVENLTTTAAFRQDLYFRLKAHHIHIPPLRQRKDDIALLVDHFLLAAATKLGKKKPTPPKELYTLLRNYGFPGNIRELEGIIYDAVSRHLSGILSLDSIRAAIHLEPVQQSEPGENGTATTDEASLTFGERLPTLKEAEERLIEEALARSNQNQSIAAEMLGLSRRALNNRLNRNDKL